MSFLNLVGQKLGQYEIRKVIGQGGLATVYLGYQAILKRYVAVKVYHGSLPDSHTRMTEISDELQRAAALEHAHIVPILDWGMLGETLYIVMRQLDESLAQRLDTGWQPNFGEISALAKEIGSALDYCHAQQVVHRDLKPSNLLFDGANNSFLSDATTAALASLLDMNITADTGARFSTIGAPAYMAPEDWQGNAVPASDQYALGVIIYRLLGGRLPVDSDIPYTMMYKHLNETPTPLPKLNPEVPAQANDVVMRALAKNVADRYPTVSAFAEALEKALPHPAKSAPSPRPTPQITPPQNQPRLASIPTPPPVVTPPVVKVAAKPRYIFISYSTRDRVLMERLAHDLDSIGHLVWYDRELQNRGGQSWWDTILEQIRQADLFVFSLTAESLASEPCSREYGYAARLNRQILPVRLAPMKTDLLPPALMQIQWVDYLDPEVALPILLASIDHLPNPPALPNPLPAPPPAPIPLINELWARGTRREELSASEQMTLLAELEILVFEGQSLDTVQQLLMQMQIRRDVSRMAHQKIEMLLQQFFVSKSPPDDEKRGRWPFGRR